MKEPRYIEVVVDFVDRVHGTGFPEIRPWEPLSAIPVDIVDVVPGTDGSNTTRPKESLGFMSPVEFRLKNPKGTYPVVIT